MWPYKSYVGLNNLLAKLMGGAFAHFSRKKQLIENIKQRAEGSLIE